MKRFAIITTHPIQYNAPLFSLLHKRNNIQVKIFYTWGEAVLENKFDPGFGKKIEWDIPLLDGYEHTFVKNIAADPGSHHFNGIDNPSLVNEIESWNPSAVLVYGWSFKSHLKAIRHFHKNIPVLFRGDSVSLKRMPPVKRMARNLFLRWMYRHIDHALYVGTHNRDYYKAAGMNDRQLVFAPHAVDNERFKKETEINADEIQAWKGSLGIETNDIVLLYAGKLDKNKNVGLLLKAFSIIDRNDVHIIIAGNGETEVALKNTFGGKKNIHFLPFQNQSRMPMLYGMAEVFVLPSLSETWGLSINEAMACSKAVLASSACGAAIDLIKDGENGYVFETNDARDLEMKLQLLISNRQALKDMGYRSEEIIRAWTFENTCKKIEELVSRLN